MGDVGRPTEPCAVYHFVAMTIRQWLIYPGPPPATLPGAPLPLPDPSQNGRADQPRRSTVTDQLAPQIDGLTSAAVRAQWPLMGTITWIYAVLTIVLAAMAVLALAAISKIEEPRPHP
jgi:hypothetical protein